MQNQLKEDNYYTVEYATEALNRNIGWINSADNKASILIAVIGFLFGGSSLLIDANKVNELFMYGTVVEKIVSVILMILFITFAISFILTLIYLFKTLLARVVKTKSSEKENIHYFKDISEMSYESFNIKIKNIKHDDILNELLSQIYETANIAKNKYINLNKCYMFLTISIIAIIIYITLLALV